MCELGWSGRVFELGEWGGGVFNGGAWLEIEGARVDVHYRDLDSVDHELAEAPEGRFRIEPLLFHLAGIPTYLVVAELALNRVLRGELPRPGYPPALRWTAPSRWWELCVHNLAYAREHHARAGRVIPCAGLLALGCPRQPTPSSPLAASGSPTTRPSIVELGWGTPTDSLSGLRAEPRALQETVDATLAPPATEMGTGSDHYGELLSWLRRSGVKPPTAGRLDRMVRSHRDRGERIPFERLSGRLSVGVPAHDRRRGATRTQSSAARRAVR